MAVSGNVGPSAKIREARIPAHLVLLLVSAVLLLAACSQPMPDATATLAADTQSGIEANRPPRVYESEPTHEPKPTPPPHTDGYADCLERLYDVDAEIDRLATAQKVGEVLVDGPVIEAVRAGNQAGR